jgi:acyl carrier protein
MREDVTNALRRLIVEDLYVEVAPEQIGLDDSLSTVVGVDSVGFAELRVLCESRFRIQIDDTDYSPANFGSVRGLTSLIDRLQTERDAAAAAKDLRLDG